MNEIIFGQEKRPKTAKFIKLSQKLPNKNREKGS